MLPTFILERRSLLEMFADCMAHPDTFIKLVYYWPHSMSSPSSYHWCNKFNSMSSSLYHVVIIGVISSIQ